MDQATAERLERSFNLLAPQGEELVECFYSRLFRTHPQLRPLFHKDMADQKKALLDILILVVQSLREPEKFRLIIFALGQRHAHYGAKAFHYAYVRTTLIDAMQEIAGDAWSTELTHEWESGLALISEIMLEGQQSTAF